MLTPNEADHDFRGITHSTLLPLIHFAIWSMFSLVHEYPIRLLHFFPIDQDVRTETPDCISLHLPQPIQRHLLYGHHLPLQLSSHHNGQMFLCAILLKTFEYQDDSYGLHSRGHISSDQGSANQEIQVPF